MKVHSFFKNFTRQFTATKSSAYNSSRTSAAAANSDKMAGRYDHTVEGAAIRAAVSASALQAGLASPVTQHAARRAASRTSKVDKQTAERHQTFAAKNSTQSFVRQAGTASSTDKVLNAAIFAQSKVDGNTVAAAQRAAKPLSLVGKVKAFFAERNS